MSPAKRHEQILARLKVDGQVSVKELAETFDISEDRIRKDLTALENQGLLKRVHGGAVPIRRNLHAFDTAERMDVAAAEKKTIARKAADLIEPGSMIFLDVSTIALETAREIFSRQIPCTVVTNMVDIMKVFSVDSPIRLIFIGGEFNRAKDGFIGALVNDQLRHLRFDLSVLGVVGIDTINQTVSTYDITDGLTKKTVIDRSKKAYAAAEAAKFSQDGNYEYASLDDFSGIISSEQISRQDQQRLQEAGISLL